MKGLQLVTDKSVWEGCTIQQQNKKFSKMATAALQNKYTGHNHDKLYSVYVDSANNVFVIVIGGGGWFINVMLLQECMDLQYVRDSGSRC